MPLGIHGIVATGFSVCCTTQIGEFVVSKHLVIIRPSSQIITIGYIII